MYLFSFFNGLTETPAGSLAELIHPYLPRADGNLKMKLDRAFNFEAG